MKKRIVSVVLSLSIFILLVSGCSSLSFSPSRDSTQNENGQNVVHINNGKLSEPDLTPKTYMEVNVKDMYDELRKNSLRASTTYNGKDVSATGFLGSIDSDGKYFALSEDGSGFLEDSIHCNLNNGLVRSQLQNFNRGDVLVVKGVITDVGETLGYYMDVESITSPEEDKRQKQESLSSFTPLSVYDLYGKTQDEMLKAYPAFADGIGSSKAEIIDQKEYQCVIINNLLAFDELDRTSLFVLFDSATSKCVYAMCIAMGMIENDAVAKYYRSVESDGKRIFGEPILKPPVESAYYTSQIATSSGLKTTWNTSDGLNIKLGANSLVFSSSCMEDDSGLEDFIASEFFKESLGEIAEPFYESIANSINVPIDRVNVFCAKSWDELCVKYPLLEKFSSSIVTAKDNQGNSFQFVVAPYFCSSDWDDCQLVLCFNSSGLCVGSMYLVTNYKPSTLLLISQMEELRSSISKQLGPPTSGDKDITNTALAGDDIVIKWDTGKHYMILEYYHDNEFLGVECINEEYYNGVKETISKALFTG